MVPRLSEHQAGTESLYSVLATPGSGSVSCPGKKRLRFKLQLLNSNFFSRLFIFEILSSLTISQPFIFADCRTVQCKKKLKYAYMDIYFREFLFLRETHGNKSLAKMNWFTVF